jgi:hypothetical protein
MDENLTVVFHGFLNLTAKEKLKLVEKINDYFDSNEREPIRAENDSKFKNIDLNSGGKNCVCCDR